MTTISIPKSTKGVIVEKSDTVDSVGFNHKAVLVDLPIPRLELGDVLVKITAAAFNHKDIWIRKGVYPGIVLGNFFGGDGAGVVVASGDPDDDLINQRVFLAPGRGWWDDPIGPEDREVSALGCNPKKPGGTFAEYVVLERKYLIKTPGYLDDIHAAAWPLGGLTAWRATMVNANVQAGQNVLITGIGGGVALYALQFSLAVGASVYVTSSHPAKIQRAIKMGAKGGVNYKDDDWPAQIRTLLEKGKKGAYLDTVIDSGGNNILSTVSPSLRAGGKVVCFGMTGGFSIEMTAQEALLNQQLIASTMGSYKDMVDATNFIEQHKIMPIVSTVLHGLESAEEGFQLLRKGEQFGKVVIEL